jgi:pimeloyl-ACP methyl ester carboxylesterase
MLGFIQRLLTLDWRRRGAAIREAPIAGSRIWYVEFHPSPAELSRLAAAARGDGAPPVDGEAGGEARPPTLVLFHGLGGSSASFHPVVSQLRAAYRLVIPDFPGYGWSRPPRGRDFLSFAELVEVAERFVVHVAPRGAYLAGNSMGGWIAAKLAARRPELVRAMALLNPGGPALRAEDWVDFARIMWAEEKGVMDDWLRRAFHKPPPGMRLFARDFRRIMKGPAVSRLMRNLQAEDFLSDEEMAKVKSPAVLVWGERDRLIPEGCRAFYLKKLKGIRYEPVPDCGHCPQLECPDRTARILLELPRMKRRARDRAGGGKTTRRDEAAAPRPRGSSAPARAPKA